METTERIPEYTREEMREACRNNYKAGFRKGQAWAVDRCQIEMVDAVPDTDDEVYNRGVHDCIEAILAMDARHAVAEFEDEE